MRPDTSQLELFSDENEHVANDDLKLPIHLGTLASVLDMKTRAHAVAETSRCLAIRIARFCEAESAREAGRNRVQYRRTNVRPLCCRSNWTATLRLQSAVGEQRAETDC